MPNLILDPQAGPFDVPVLPIGVYRWWPEAGGYPWNGRVEPLPHVAFEGATWMEGSRPPVCTLRYLIDLYAEADPVPFETVVGVGAANPLVLRTDDRVFAATIAVDGTPRYLFDGFVEMPGFTLGADAAEVPIKLSGVGKRLYDSVLVNALWAGIDEDGETFWVPAETGIVFNRDGIPNMTGESYGRYEDEYGNTYNTFVDPYAAGSWEQGGAGDDDAKARRWTLEEAVHYILCRGNPIQSLVKNPPLEELQYLLRSIEPTSPGVPIDLGNPSTYEYRPVPCGEVDVSDLPVAAALDAVLRGTGFTWKFEIRTAVSGAPETYIQCYPEGGPIAGAERVLYLQRPGQLLDTSLTNLAQAQLQRDAASIVNVWKARIRPTMIEAPFLLLPGFTPEIEADIPESATVAERKGAIRERMKALRKTSGNSDGIPYRLFRFSEAGEGFWQCDPEGDGEYIEEVVDPAKALGFEGAFAPVRRPASASRLIRDDEDNYREPVLGVVFSKYTDADGHEVGHFEAEDLAKPRVLKLNEMEHVQWMKSGWALDPDQLAIRITANDPNDVPIGATDVMPGLNAGRLKLVDWLNGTNGEPKRAVGFVLLAAIPDDGKLTEVVVNAKGVEPEPIVVDRRPSSPTRWTVARTVDMSDRHFLDLKHLAGIPGEETGIRGHTHIARGGAEANIYDVVRDNRPQAVAELTAMADKAAFSRFSGTVQVDRLVNAYRVGTRISRIEGRDLDLRGSVTGSGLAVYPRVTAVSYSAGNGQYTQIQLED